MRIVERLRRMRGRLAIGAGVAFPLVTGLFWCFVGRPLLGVLGIATAVMAARLYRRRTNHPLFLLPTWLVGDPNQRKPIIIERERWPRGQG